MEDFLALVLFLLLTCALVTATFRHFVNVRKVDKAIEENRKAFLQKMDDLV